MKIEQTVSATRSITSGVPQGSHLAPSPPPPHTLFLLYINTFPDSLHHSSPFLFVDDVTLLYAHHRALSLDENRSNVQQELDSYQQWARSVHGEFSPEKTSSLCNYQLSTSSPTRMDNIPIRHPTSVVHLEVELSPDLKFYNHFATVFRKFRQRVTYSATWAVIYITLTPLCQGTFALQLNTPF